MTTEKLFGFKEGLEDEGLLFCYSGPVSQGLVEEIGEVIKRKMEIEEITLSITQKVFGIFVEQVQNIMFHSAESKYDDSGHELRSGIVAIGKKKHSYHILCGNLVAYDEKQRLEGILKRIEGKDKPALKAMYVERLKDKQLERGKGAGLGLIDIARKSSEPLVYSFRMVDDNYYFFSSKATIEEEGTVCNH